MKALTEPILQLSEMQELCHGLSENRGLRVVSGCIDSQKLHWIQGCNDGFKRKIIVTYSENKAKELFDEYRFYDPEACFYPAKDLLFYQADVRGNQITAQRMELIKDILEDGRRTVITTFAALMDRLIPEHRYKKSILNIDSASLIDTKVLASNLVRLGYDRSYQVEQKGQFSIRGNIIDVFSLVESVPYRIELWGDEVDSIRTFDPSTQRTIENIERICIYPASELIVDESELSKGLEQINKDAAQLIETYKKRNDPEHASFIKQRISRLNDNAQGSDIEAYFDYFIRDRFCLLDYFRATETLVFIDEPLRSLEQGKGTQLEFEESYNNRILTGEILGRQADIIFSAKEVVSALMDFSCVGLCSLDNVKQPFKVTGRYYVNAVSVPSYQNDFLRLIKDLKKYKKDGYKILIISPSGQRARRLAADITDEGINAFYSEDPDRTQEFGEIILTKGYIKKGFEYPLIRFAVISEGDIFTKHKQRKKVKDIKGKGLSDFNELKIGDYVIHEGHGCGIYKGMQTMAVDGVEKEYLKLEFAGGGTLYVLATQLEKIQKYSSGDGKKPRINSLSNSDWHKTKAKVQRAVEELAKDLIELYAIRMNRKGYSYGPDTVWQTEFEEMFPYDETDDQIRAIEAVKRDMESQRVMDRIICGDVGFGKTEVAIRAAFKAVQDNKQVAMLVPTTILAQQHYQTFTQRMKDYPLTVRMLSRFQTKAQQDKIVKEIASGRVDIVIGTHRLLSEDLHFRDLGLLVIDEEQRFGVRHKEKIKKLKYDVDVLMLSATPIPRTMHMGLSGIRDMSVLEEPPVDRIAIQTYVCEYRDELIREAIIREIGRGGQVYYVYNRVNGIEDLARHIEELVPEITVGYAHGQMNERQLENIMYQFINGDIDVLVSTTIIETGLDIPNVNTIIIHDADRFGLSQLYQLRGRVGRTNRTSYAFLLYRRDKQLKEEAEKRLSAIREFTALGSGIRIAMRDLEIRGTGNILGVSQHGHMELVGYDLYCKMLKNAIKLEKGEKRDEENDITVDLPINAYIPSKYISSEFVKLDIYKRIAGVLTYEEIEELADELTDRFSDPPQSVQNLLFVAGIKVSARALGIIEISGKPSAIHLYMNPKADIKADKIPECLNESNKIMTFKADNKPCFVLNLSKYDDKKWTEGLEKTLTIMKDKLL